MYGRILLGTLIFSGLALATPLVVPTDQIFQNIPTFDELEVTLKTTGAAFADTLPLTLTGPGTDDWSSNLLTDQRALATGPVLESLTRLTLNLAAVTQPVKLVVRFRYHGDDVRSLQVAYDGAQWTVTALDPAGDPLGVSFDITDLGPGGSGIPGSPGGNPSGPTGPTGPTGDPSGSNGQPVPDALTPVPEPSLAGAGVLALMALVAAGRRKRR